MSIKNTLEELEKIFKAGSKPTEAHFKKLINTYVVKGEGDKVGIGTQEPKNTLDVKGQMVVGAGFGGEEVAPPNGLIVQGNVGIGHNIAETPLHVNGNVRIDEGGLTIGGREVISNTGVWHGTLPDQDGQEGSALWTDGNEQVTTTVRVGIGETSPSAELHVKGNIKVDEGNLDLMGPNAKLNVNGLVTKQNVCFTATANSLVTEGQSARLIFDQAMTHAEPEPFTILTDSIFKPDEALSGTYFFTVSITMTEATEATEQEDTPAIEEEVEGKTEDKAVEPDENEEDPKEETTTVNPGKPAADGAIFFSITEDGQRHLTIREPNACLHSSASLVHSFDGQTQLTLHASPVGAGVKIARITLTGYRL